MGSAESPIRGVRFRVAEFGPQRAFYEQVLGLDPHHEGEGEVHLAGGDEAFRVELDHEPAARPRTRPSIGLFHVAYLLPDRRSLAEALAHLREQDVEIEGMADHGVSEAVYLSDREGNGIELYRDRPPEEWPRKGDEIAMVTDPLDARDLLARAEQPRPPPAGTRIGHIHLHVPELARAERFFVDGLGLSVRQRDYPGALFMAGDDYHHHVGANTWARGRRADPDAVGLESYTWTGEAEAIARRLEELGHDVHEGDGAVWVEDPAGLRLRIEDRT